MVVEGKRKQLHHLSFGCYSDDLPYLQERADGNGVELLDPPKGFESNGFWFRDPAGLLVEIKVAAKVTPAHKTPGTWSSSPEGVAGAPVRAEAPIVRPRRLSHVLVFTPDVDRSCCGAANSGARRWARALGAIITSWRSRNRRGPGCITAAGT